MKIRKMTASFGALENKGLSLGEGLNIIYAPNESGKSTWCAFLKAMLYGINTSQRAKQGQQPDKVKYRPWSGLSMGGSMDVETGGDAVTIQRRTQRATQPMQVFSATVTGTDDPVPGLTAEGCGEALTGVPREVFERTAFIRQAGLAVSSDPALEKRINALVTAGDEEQSYSQTNDRLQAWRRHRSGRAGAIGQLTAAMEENRKALDQLGQAGQKLEHLDAAITAAEQQQAQAVQTMEQARAAQRRDALAAMSEAKKRTQEQQQAFTQAEREEITATAALNATPYGTMRMEAARRRTDNDARKVRELEKLAAKIPPLWLPFIPLGVAAVAFLLSFVLAWQSELIATGAVLVLLFVMMYLRLQGMKKTKADTLAEREKILTAYGVNSPEQMEALLDAYRPLWDAWQRATYRREEAEQLLQRAEAAQKDAESRIMSGLDFSETGSSPAALASRTVQAGQRQLDQLRQQRAMLVGQTGVMGDPMVLQSEMLDQTQRLQALIMQDEALALAIEIMEQADRDLRSRFSPQLASRAAELFSRLTGGNYDQVTLARDLTAKAKRTQDAVSQEEGYLSQGARDQLYLALRLALCQLVLTGEEACPIVLDDALVTFDTERMAAALALLKEMAETRQILLFTCQERELEYFVNDQSVTIVHLA